MELYGLLIILNGLDLSWKKSIFASKKKLEPLECLSLGNAWQKKNGNEVAARRQQSDDGVVAEW